MSLVPYLFFFRHRLWLWHDISLRARIHKHRPTVAAIIVCLHKHRKQRREKGRTSIELHAYIFIEWFNDIWSVNAHKKSLRVQVIFHISGAVDPNLNTYRMCTMYTIASRRLSKAYWTVKKNLNKGSHSHIDAHFPMSNWFWFDFGSGFAPANVILCVCSVFLRIFASTPKLRNNIWIWEKSGKSTTSIHPSIVIMVWIYVDIFSTMYRSVGHGDQ